MQVDIISPLAYTKIQFNNENAVKSETLAADNANTAKTEKPSKEEMTKLAEKLQKLLSTGANIAINFDKKTNMEMLSITDKETGRLIKEMPPKAVREIVSNAKNRVFGLFLDRTI